jgi:hypothetical protein
MRERMHVRSRAWRHLLVVIVGCLGLVLTGCGRDDGAGVRTLGSEDGGLGDASASGTPLSLPSGVSREDALGSLTGPAIACEPTGTELPAETTVEVTIADDRIELSRSEAATGIIRFEVRNAGDEPHELLILFSAEPAELPVDDDGGVDESELTDNTVIGEVEVFPPGTTCPGVFNLPPGEYVLFCNVVEIDEGANDSHYENGERVSFTVT